MSPVDIENCLESMIVLVDTREQESDRFAQRVNTLGVPYRKQTLDYGDYTYNFTLPDGTELFDSEETVKGHVVIERKMDLEELSSCFCQSRARFKKEFEKAIQNNATIYLLVEDGSWEKILHGRYKTKFNPDAYIASLSAWMARYNIKVIFCQHEISGQLIKQFLYRELKERLENGFYG